MKRLLFIIILGLGSPAFAMEPEPEFKKAKTEPKEATPALEAPAAIQDRLVQAFAWIEQEIDQRIEQNQPIPFQEIASIKRRTDTLLDYARNIEILSALEKIYPVKHEEKVSIISSDDFTFSIPLSAARRSHQIADLLEGSPQQKEFCLNLLARKATFIFALLLMHLDLVMIENELLVMKNEPTRYVPSAYQPRVNSILNEYRIDKATLGSLYNAALMLDAPYIINALARHVAHVIYPILAHKEKQQSYTAEEIQENAAKNGIIIPIDKIEYIQKFLEMQRHGISKEYSVADYIAEHGQPEIKEFEHTFIDDFDDEYDVDGEHVINLDSKQLTSLFGIELIENKNEVEHLILSNNFFMYSELDPQAENITLQGFNNLTDFVITRSFLTYLPESFFAELRTISGINFSHNRIGNHLHPKLLSKLDLGRIDLNDCGITALPADFFADLKFLGNLSMKYNGIAELPVNIFANNQGLLVLDLSNNKLNRLPENVFQPFARYIEYLFLDDNNLHNLTALLFEGMRGLCSLSLGNNPLTEADKENIKKIVREEANVYLDD